MLNIFENTAEFLCLFVHLNSDIYFLYDWCFKALRVLKEQYTWRGVSHPFIPLLNYVMGCDNYSQ